MTVEIYVTGIGSREALDPDKVPPNYPKKDRLAPAHINAQMIELGELFARLGFTLRSGAADGADAAFEAGWDRVPGSKKEIFLPWPGFNKHDGNQAYYLPQKDVPKFEAIAATLHPIWEQLKADPSKQGVIKLHTRNVGQVLGKYAQTPSHMLVCWTPDGCTGQATRSRNTGGTGTAIVLAERFNVPIFNLYHPGAFESAVAYAHRLARQRDRRFHPEGALPTNGETFVFGSNLAGRHGKGAALVAREQFGAVYGQGEGPQGRSYAIASKDGRPGTPPLTDKAATLSLTQIKEGVDRFIEYANSHPGEQFFLPRIGCALAAHSDADIAPMFDMAPANCVFSDDWKPWLGLPEHTTRESSRDVSTAEPINIFSGAPGLGGALTNMSERAREKGRIKHSYPVVINDVRYVDSEAAYQALKIPGNDEYNDGLMIDIIALKFKQNTKLFDLVKKYGGAAWLEKCSHFTNAKSASFQSWEGQGNGSRFIRNLVFGYKKAVTGLGPKTRVVHVEQAPYDVYIGRDMTAKNPKYVNQGLGNTVKVRDVGSVDTAVRMFSELLEADPALKLKALAVKGRTIGCWCKRRENYEALCHGDVIAAVADGRPWVPQTVVQAELF